MRSASGESFKPFFHRIAVAGEGSFNQLLSLGRERDTSRTAVMGIVRPNYQAAFLQPIDRSRHGARSEQNLHRSASPSRSLMKQSLKDSEVRRNHSELGDAAAGRGLDCPSCLP